MTRIGYIAAITGLSLLVSAAPSEAETPKLRTVHLRLIETTKVKNVSPPISRRVGLGCISAGKPGRYGPERPVTSPFSSLPKALKRHHRRVTFRAGRFRYEMHDSLVFRAPRVFKYDVTLPRAARVEMVYRVNPCRSNRSHATMRLVVRQGGRTVFQKFNALRQVAGRSPLKPWTKLEIPIPPTIKGKAQLEFDFRPTAEARSVPIIWGEPLISGLPDAQDGTRDMNVLLIIIDALRSDMAGPGNNPTTAPLAPFLNRYFREGTSFSQAFSASNQTRHSTLAFLASQHPTLGGFFTRSWLARGPLRRAFYQRKPPLLPRIMGAHGWYVTTIGHNRFQFASNPFGIDHGFDHIYDDRRRIGDTEWLREKAIKFFDMHKKDRWFLYLNLVAPHLPYRPPQQYIDRVKAMNIAKKLRIPANYLAEVLYVDTETRRVIDALKSMNLERKTLVVITADHGELFGRHHGCWSNRFQQNCHFNHGLTLYNEEIHVPLAFILPGKVKSNHVVKTLTSQLHVAPTILDLVGIPQNPLHTGEPLQDALAGRPTKDEVLYFESRTGTALIKGRWKVHAHSRLDDARTKARRGTPEQRRLHKIKGLPRYQLFDLKTDPEERHNLALGAPEKVQPFLEEMKKIRLKLATKLARARQQGTAGPTGARQSFRGASVNKLRLTSDGTVHELRGFISVNRGHISCACSKNLFATAPCFGTEQALCVPRGPQRIEIRLKSGKTHPQLAFTTLPRNTPITFALELDDKPLATDRLRIGPFGVRLLSAGERFDTVARLSLLTGRHGPKTRERDDTAVYVWRNPRTAATEKLTVGRGATKGTAPAIQILGPDELDSKPVSDRMSPELRKVLKDLGYTQ